MFTFQLATIDLLPIKTQNRKCVTTPARCYKWLGVPARCYESLNFPAKLCGWIRECVTTPAILFLWMGRCEGFSRPCKAFVKATHYRPTWSSYALNIYPGYLKCEHTHLTLNSIRSFGNIGYLTWPLQMILWSWHEVILNLFRFWRMYWRSLEPFRVWRWIG